jgi:hypothetical protein
MISLAGVLMILAAIGIAGTTSGRGESTLAAVQAQTVPDCVVDCPTKQAFQEGFILSIPADTLNGTHTISIPSGKRLVIENVTARALMPSLQNLNVTLSTQLSGGPSVGHYLNVTDKPVGTVKQFQVSQSLTLYADSGSISAARTAIPGLMSAMTVYGSVSGHLVD